MRYGMTVLHGHWHTAPPVVASSGPHHSGVPSHLIAGLSPNKNRIVQPHPLNVGSLVHCSVICLRVCTNWCCGAVVGLLSSAGKVTVCWPWSVVAVIS